MNSKKIAALTLSFLMICPVTAFAKGNEKSNGKSNQTIQSTQLKKSEDSKNKLQDKDKDNNEKDVEKEDIENDEQSSSTQTQTSSTAKANVKGQEHKQAAQQKKADKQQQIATFKAAMKVKHEQMKTLKQQIAAVRTSIEQKKAQLEAIVAALQSGEKTLPEDMLKELLAAGQNLQLDTMEVQLTAEVKSEVTDAQSKVEKSDFNNALASMDKVLAKFQARLDSLNKLNADLDAALKIANMAAVPAQTTTDAPAAPADTTNTSTPADSSTGTSTTAEPSSTDTSTSTNASTSADTPQTTSTSDSAAEAN